MYPKALPPSYNIAPRPLRRSYLEDSRWHRNTNKLQRRRRDILLSRGDPAWCWRCGSSERRKLPWRRQEEEEAPPRVAISCVVFLLLLHRLWPSEARLSFSFLEHYFPAVFPARRGKRSKDGEKMQCSEALLCLSVETVFATSTEGEKMLFLDARTCRKQLSNCIGTKTNFRAVSCIPTNYQGYLYP